MKYNSFCFCFIYFNSSARCQEIASSRSSSLTKPCQLLASAFNLLTSAFYQKILYLGLKPCSTSTLFFRRQVGNMPCNLTPLENHYQKFLDRFRFAGTLLLLNSCHCSFFWNKVSIFLNIVLLRILKYFFLIRSFKIQVRFTYFHQNKYRNTIENFNHNIFKGWLFKNQKQNKPVIHQL
jgi:hypothetical protein